MRSIACPKCRTKLAGSPDLLGVAVRCSKCGQTFTASVANSPYIEGLPPEPGNRRPLILGGAVALSLLLVTLFILGLNWLEDSKTDTGIGTGGVTPQVERKTTPDLTNKKLMTANGIPIELPDDDGPDRVPQPGFKWSPAIEKAMALTEKDAATKAVKPAGGLDDVVLAFVKWDYAGSHRTLKIGYGFVNNQSPGAGLFTLKLRIDGDAKNVSSLPLDAALDANGVLAFKPETVPIGERRAPKVEAWVERTAAGVGQKVSNVVSTE